VNNFLKIILILITVTSCSLHSNSKFWTKQKIVEEKQEISKKETDNIKQVFKKEEVLSKEFNPSLKISLYSKPIKKSFLNNFDNNMNDVLDDLQNAQETGISQNTKGKKNLQIDIDENADYDQQNDLANQQLNDKLLQNQ